MPRKMLEAIGRLLKSDQVLSRLDLQARAGYDARMAREAESTPATAPESLATQEPGVEPAGKRATEAA
jgi:hypothetical protein